MKRQRLLRCWALSSPMHYRVGHTLLDALKGASHEAD